MEAGTLQDTEMQSLMKEDHLTIYIDYETHQLRELSCQTRTCHAQAHSQSHKFKVVNIQNSSKRIQKHIAADQTEITFKLPSGCHKYSHESNIQLP